MLSFFVIKVDFQMPRTDVELRLLTDVSGLVITMCTRSMSKMGYHIANSMHDWNGAGADSDHT